MAKHGIKRSIAVALVALSLAWGFWLRHVAVRLERELSDDLTPRCARSGSGALSACSLIEEPNAGNSYLPSLTNPGENPKNVQAVSFLERGPSLTASFGADSDAINESLEQLARSIPVAGLAAKLDSLLGDGDPGAAELGRLLARRWAEADPPAASAWAAQLPETAAARDVVIQVALGWATTSPAQATAWVQSLAEGPRKQDATLSLAYETARTDPAAAFAQAAVLPQTAERDNLLVHAISQWAAVEPQSATLWAGRTADGNLRQRLLASVTIALAQQDAHAAAVLAANALRPGKEQDCAVVAIVQRWAQQSPEDAARWVTQFPEAPARVAAAQNLVALWSLHEALAVRNWIGTLPEGSLRTTSLAAYAQALLQHDQQ